jgi:hypothetical protein
LKTTLLKREQKLTGKRQRMDDPEITDPLECLPINSLS